MVEAEASGEQEEALARSYPVLDAAYVMLGPVLRRPSTAALAIYDELGDQTGTAVVTEQPGRARHTGRALGGRRRFLRAPRTPSCRPAMSPRRRSAVRTSARCWSWGRLEDAEPVLWKSPRCACFGRTDWPMRRSSRDPAGATAPAARRRRRDGPTVGHPCRGDPDPVGCSRRSEAAIWWPTGSSWRAGLQGGAGHARRNGAGLRRRGELYGSTIARARARALAALGRAEEARGEVTAGVAQAREQGSSSRWRNSDSSRPNSRGPIGRARRARRGRGLLQGLGVVDTTTVSRS